MRQLGLTLAAHPALPWLWVLLAVGTAMWFWRRGFTVPRLVSAVGGAALATAFVAEVGPQPLIGYGSGLTQRVCDVQGWLPLAPWSWGVADIRVGPILMHLVAGAAALLGSRSARVPLLVAGVVCAPLAEVAQWLFPQIARTCTTLDIVDAWAGLAAGVALAAVLIWLAGSPRRTIVIAVVIVLAGVATTVLTRPPAGGIPALSTDPSWGRPDAATRRATQTWIESGTVPGAGTAWEPMARTALADIYRSGVKDLDRHLPPAGEADGWRLFWPRDGAFLAVALARTGHGQDARRLLERMAALPFDADHGLDARFMPDGSPVHLSPRAPQADNCGWVLWAVAQVRGSVALPPVVDGLRDRCAGQLLRLTGAGSHIPGASADYWEVTTWRSSLGVSAPVLLGLRSATADTAATGSPSPVLSASADRFAGVLRRAFGPAYERFGDTGGLDASACMLALPPGAAQQGTLVRERCRQYAAQARRDSGGVAPGVDWKQDGISWTPQTALLAYVETLDGDAAAAHPRLDWLQSQRTTWGSLPEKVKAGGVPAGPAPLLWTASLVVLTLAAQDDVAAR